MIFSGLNVIINVNRQNDNLKLFEFEKFTVTIANQSIQKKHNWNFCLWK